MLPRQLVKPSVCTGILSTRDAISPSEGKPGTIPNEKPGGERVGIVYVTSHSTSLRRLFAWQVGF